MTANARTHRTEHSHETSTPSSRVDVRGGLQSLAGMRVMGIDPGLTRCGLSVVQAGKGRAVYPIAVGVVRTPVDAPLEQRLRRLSDAVNEWMDQYQPEVIALERVFERSNVSTVMNTAHASGVLMLAAAQRNLDVFMYTPSEVKKAVSGNGRADKAQMTNMITRILGLSEPPKPADAADALALAVCHCWRAPLNAMLRPPGARGTETQAQPDWSMPR